MHDLSELRDNFVLWVRLLVCLLIPPRLGLAMLNHDRWHIFLSPSSCSLTVRTGCLNFYESSWYKRDTAASTVGTFWGASTWLSLSSFTGPTFNFLVHRYCSRKSFERLKIPSVLKDLYQPHYSRMAMTVLYYDVRPRNRKNISSYLDEKSASKSCLIIWVESSEAVITKSCLFVFITSYIWGVIYPVLLWIDKGLIS